MASTQIHAGPTMQLADPVTGKARTVYLFVGCLPISRYAFVEPTLDMKQDTWLRAHVAMFDAFTGSVPRIVPDNLQTGVIKHPREGEVVLNDAYREMAVLIRRSCRVSQSAVGSSRGGGRPILRSRHEMNRPATATKAIPASPG
jgi:hypothetical protein